MQWTVEVKKFSDGLWAWHFQISVEDIHHFFEDFGHHKRIIWQYGTHAGPAALMQSGGYWYIMLSMAIVKKLRLELGSSLEISVSPDTSTYGMPLDPIFEMVLHGDEEGKHFFDQLTPGKQRALIHLITKVKSEDLKISKSLAMMHHLKETRGKLDFKILNEGFKAFRSH